MPGGDADGKWWTTLPALLGAVAGLITACVAAAALFVGANGDEPATPATTDQNQKARPPVPFPPSRLVSSAKVGLYEVEANGSIGGAEDVLGFPSEEKRRGSRCDVTWEDAGVQMLFVNFGGDNPCKFGYFCSAHIYGNDWATTRGAQIGESVRRLWRLYDTKQLERPGAITYWRLEQGTYPCGRDPGGGLVAATAGGRIVAYDVSFLAAGD